MNKVYIFTLPTCAPCNELKRQLAEKEEQLDLSNIEITYFDMSQPNDFTLEAGEKYHVRSCPTVVVFDKDNNIYYNGTMVRTADRILELVAEANIDE